MAKDGGHALQVALVRMQAAMMESGDRAAIAGESRSAWRAYLRSFAAWPFDAVVAVRALALYPVKAAFARGTAP